MHERASLCAKPQADSRKTRKGTAIKSHWTFKMVQRENGRNYHLMIFRLGLDKAEEPKIVTIDHLNSLLILSLYDDYPSCRNHCFSLWSIVKDVRWKGVRQGLYIHVIIAANMPASLFPFQSCYWAFLCSRPSSSHQKYLHSSCLCGTYKLTVQTDRYTYTLRCVIRSLGKMFYVKERRQQEIHTRPADLDWLKFLKEGCEEKKSKDYRAVIEHAQRSYRRKGQDPQRSPVDLMEAEARTAWPSGFSCYFNGTMVPLQVFSNHKLSGFIVWLVESRTSYT